MLSLILTVAVLSAEPSKTVGLAEYVAEVNAVIAKADEENSPKAKQSALVKGLTAINKSYARSKAKMTLTYPVTMATRGNGRASGGLANFNIRTKPAEEFEGIQNISGRDSITVPMGMDFGQKLSGGKIAITGVPVLSTVSTDADCTLTAEGRPTLHIRLANRSLQPVQR